MKNKTLTIILLSGFANASNLGVFANMSNKTVLLGYYDHTQPSNPIVNVSKCIKSKGLFFIPSAKLDPDQVLEVVGVTDQNICDQTSFLPAIDNGYSLFTIRPNTSAGTIYLQSGTYIESSGFSYSSLGGECSDSPSGAGSVYYDNEVNNVAISTDNKLCKIQFVQVGSE